MLNFDKFYAKLTADIKAEVDAEKDQYIANADTNELVNYYCAHKMLTPIETDTSRETTSDITSTIDTRLPKDYKNFQAFIDKSTDLEIETLIIEFPIKSNPSNTTACQICSYIDEERTIKLQKDAIVIKIEIKEHALIKKTEDIQQEISAKRNRVFDWLKTAQQHLAGLNQHLMADIKHRIEQRKAKLAATKKRHEEIIRRINIPLKRKEDTLAKKIRLDTMPLVKRIRPSMETKENYVLDREKVLDIIQVMDNQGRQFEKTPLSYEKLGEDDLRNILLVNLNSVFEGKAVGEAFSNRGKTDITLNIDKGNILIIECKIWGGSKKHLEAVSQLISYLTWRHTYGIVINFCRNKDMLKIIQTIKEEIKTHPTFIRNGKATHETHFSTVHQSPSDAQKLIEIHHVFYNLFTQ